MRITMSMASKQYAKNLSASFERYTKATTKATTFNNFDNATEDPVGSMKAYKRVLQISQNSNYQSSVSSLESQFKTADSTLTSIQTLTGTASGTDYLKAITGTMTEENRGTIATELRTLQAQMVTAANTQYGGSYLFGGANTADAPFTVGTDNQLYYRGINVTTGAIAAGTTATLNGTQITLGDTAGTYNGYTINIAEDSAATSDSAAIDDTNKTITVTMKSLTGKTNDDVLTALKSNSAFANATMTGDTSRPVDITATAVATNNVGQDGLKALADEASYVDIGAGLSFNADGSINSQSVFDASITGLSFLGYGTTDGSANNLYTIMGEIADQLDSSSYSFDTTTALIDKFNTQTTALSNVITKVGTSETYLTSVESSLTTAGTNLDDDWQNIKTADVETTYIEQTSATLAYNCAIKVGSDLLSKTLLDYMS
jgi:flagellin-like hook-associated protein FlgL